MTQNVPKMQYKKLASYSLPKGQEIYYIKKFVNGVTKLEFEEMFMSPVFRAIFNMTLASMAIEETWKSFKKSGLLK